MFFLGFGLAWLVVCVFALVGSVRRDLAKRRQRRIQGDSYVSPASVPRTSDRFSPDERLVSDYEDAVVAYVRAVTTPVAAEDVPRASADHARLYADLVMYRTEVLDVLSRAARN